MEHTEKKSDKVLTLNEIIISHLNFLEKKQDGVQAIISDRDFSGEKIIYKIKLDNSTFENIDLTGLSLSGGNFKKSVFKNVDFSKCDLRGTDFSSSTFEGCTFSESFLHGTIFKGCFITDCDFSYSKLIGTNFYNAKIIKSDFNGMDKQSSIISDRIDSDEETKKTLKLEEE